MLGQQPPVAIAPRGSAAAARCLHACETACRLRWAAAKAAGRTTTFGCTTPHKPDDNLRTMHVLRVAFGVKKLFEILSHAETVRVLKRDSLLPQPSRLEAIQIELDRCLLRDDKKQVPAKVEHQRAADRKRDNECKHHCASPMSQSRRHVRIGNRVKLTKKGHERCLSNEGTYGSRIDSRERKAEDANIESTHAQPAKEEDKVTVVVVAHAVIDPRYIAVNLESTGERVGTYDSDGPF